MNRASSKEILARRRSHKAEFRRAQTADAQNIKEIPRCKHPARRKSCMADFGLFAKTYFSAVFDLPWSKDHLKVVGKAENVIVHDDNLAVAMPRGSGKTAICRAAALWGTLRGGHPFVVFIGATAPRGSETMTWLKNTLLTNDLLLEDFPEVLWPIRAMGGEPRRCKGQRYRGKNTNIVWGRDQIVLPTIARSKCSGHTILATSLEGHFLGLSHALPDGRTVRPTLAIVDDPQTQESARSQGPSGQTTYRLQLINQAVRGLAGPKRKTGILVPCTVIVNGDLADQLLDHKRHPDFRGERTKRMYSWPINKALWEQYRELRESLLEAKQPIDEANEFYRAHMARCGRRLDEERDCSACPGSADCMDCGAVIDWVCRTDDPRNLSALQATMHALYEYGPAGFAAEMQNEPLAADSVETRLTAAMVQMRYNGRPRHEVPLECNEVTVGVDVQQSSLWYVAVAWTRNFTGYVIDYGVWPGQQRRIFTARELADANSNLQSAYPGRGVEGTIQAGLVDLVGGILATDYVKAGGAGLVRSGRVLVDAGDWPGTIAAVKHKVGGSVMMLSKGVGIRAGSRPMSAYKRKAGERYGEHWYTPTVQGTREFPHVALDTNYWKWQVQQAFLTAPGDPGALTIFGADPSLHELFAAHIDAEFWEKTHGHGRDVYEFKVKPGRPDNHWFDALVYAAVAASMQGISSPNRKEPPRTGVIRRRRVPIDELMAGRDRHEGVLA